MKLLKLALPLLALALLTGCASQLVATAEPLCKAVENTCISKDDVLTEKTASTIEGNNLGRARVCGKPPPCKAQS